MHKIEKCFASESDMKKINALSRRELLNNEVYTFTVTLCDNDIDRDFEKFSVPSLYELQKLFEGKTGISDHSMRSSDQKARIFETYVEKISNIKTADGEDLYRLKAKAYMLKNEDNKALIDEIEAGIKKEVSVSCSMKKSVCSICGNDKRQGRCEHINGKTYGAKLCYSVLEGAEDAYEFSFVAVPAQRSAGVTKSFNNAEGTDMNTIMNTIKSCGESGCMLSKTQAAELVSYINNLEDEAKLGEEYKNMLSKDVVKLFSLKFPNMDQQLFTSVVSVMTASELKGFKNGLESSGETSSVPQLMPIIGKDENKDNSYFRI